MVIQTLHCRVNVVLSDTGLLSDISLGHIEEKGPYTDTQQALRKSYKKRSKHHRRANQWEDNGIYFELTLSVCSFNPVVQGTTNTRGSFVANMPSFGLWVANPRDILALSEIGAR